MKWSITVSLLLLLAASKSHAVLDFTNLAGTHDLFKADYEFLSPAYGFSYIRRGTLENIYRWGGELRQNNNKAHSSEDAIARFVRDNFNLPAGDEGNLQVTQLKIKPVFYFRSSTYGKILNLLVVENNGIQGLKKLLASPRSTQDLKNQLIDAIASDTGLYTSKRIEATAKHLKKERAACVPETPEEIRLSKLHSELNTILDRLKTRSTQATEAANGVSTWVDTLIAALKHSLGIEPPASHENYPEHFPLQALSSLFWLQASNTPQELRDYFAAMRGALKSPEQDFAHPPFSEKDYRDLKALYSHSSGGGLAQLRSSPEKIEFLQKGSQIFESHSPPIVNSGHVVYHSKKSLADLKFEAEALGLSHAADLKNTDGIETYTDCFEAAHRNLLRSMLFDPGRRRLSPDLLLKAAQESGHEVSPGLLQHFIEFPHTDNPDDQAARNSWSWLNTNLENATYRKENSELRTGIRNFEAFYQKHLFSRDTHGHYAKLTTSEQKMDYLCKFLSRDGKALTWSLKDSTGATIPNATVDQRENDYTVVFNINGEPDWEMTLSPGHSFARKVEKPDTRTALSPFQIQIDTLSQEKSPKLKAYAQPTASPPDKLKAIRLLLNESSLEAHSIATRLVRALPSGIENQRRVAAILADAHEPPSALETETVRKLRTVYTLAIQQDITKKYGSQTAEKMGKSYMRDFFGHKIALGVALKTSQTGQSKAVTMDQKSAVEACLRLNKESSYASVKEAFEQRNRLIEQAMQLADLSKKEQELEQIHRLHAVPGCYLMSQFEWNVVGSDLGYPHHYLPEMIPELTLQFGSYWTSTLKENAPESVSYYRFNGNTGQSMEAARAGNKNTVQTRCGCQI